MRSLFAALAAAFVLACCAAPAMSMPIRDSGSDSGARLDAAPEPVTAVPDASGIGTAVVVLIGAGALLAGAGVGFGAARTHWRARSVAAG